MAVSQGPWPYAPAGTGELEELLLLLLPQAEEAGGSARSSITGTQQ